MPVCCFSMDLLEYAWDRLVLICKGRTTQFDVYCFIVSMFNVFEDQLSESRSENIKIIFLNVLCFNYYILE